MSRFSRAAASAAALAFVFTAFACTSAPDATEPIPKNQADWVLPLDAYMMNETEISTMQFAWTLLSLACMSTSGRPLTLPDRAEIPLSESDSWNSVGRFIFTIDTASKYGYHVAPPADPDLSAEWYDFKHSSYSDSDLELLHSCQKGAWDQLPDLEQQDEIMANFAGRQAASRRMMKG